MASAETELTRRQLLDALMVVVLILKAVMTETMMMTTDAKVIVQSLLDLVVLLEFLPRGCLHVVA